MTPLLTSLRPRHWIKNAWLGAPLLFAGRLGDAGSVSLSAGIALSFCALSSAVYLLNDVHDAARDRLHPLKRERPVAAGLLAPRPALLCGALLAALGLAGSALVQIEAPHLPGPVGAPSPAAAALPLGLGAAWWGLAYLLNGVLYTLLLKALPALDVLAIAAGFVIRLTAGSAALGLLPSHWLLICGFALALLLALGKRRLELLAPAAGSATRPALAHYQLPALDRLLLLSAVGCLATYLLYGLSPVTVAKMGSHHLLFGLAPVAAALGRFLWLLRHAPHHDLAALLLGDRWLLGCALLWLLSALAVVGPWRLA